jgi:ribonucleoside-triphosphate reductase (thioredoxin)
MVVYNSLPTQYQQFMHLSRYARWLDTEGRRENWPETVERYIHQMCDVQCEGKITDEMRLRLFNGIKDLEAMPSMRALMTAGPALERDNAAGYNCTGLVLDDIAAFDEALYLLMCGCGVGYSVERQFVTQLPKVVDRLRPSKTLITVEDSRIGWANALRELISMLYQGRIPAWDTSLIRPKGARLSTFGGRASGPEPLEDLFAFVVHKFGEAAGRKLNSLECHDIMCKIADAVVAGGVRRSALLSLSNPSDDRMRHAKAGNWWDTEPQRALANNSSCYTERPGMDVFIREWLALYDSKSGERGIFNREAVVKQAAKSGRRDCNYDFITNPCSEIIFRPCGMCNLSEVVARADDTLKTLKRKVELAVILGSMQATLTNFRYLRDVWKQNAEEEALLGVSLTGIMDSDLLSGRNGKRELKEALVALREYAVLVNKRWAKKLGINQAVAVTCVKPSGTVSQLVNASSGIHPRYSHYYIRTVRAHKTDPLARMMQEMGFPVEDDVTKPAQTWVFSFPVKSPDKAVTHTEFTALDQLELWKVYQHAWCEHKVSMTVHVHEHEWMRVGAWVYDNFDIISGIAFLPATTHNYRQAPYQECTEDEYREALSKMPEVDWAKLREYESDDEFSSRNAREFACTAGACEVVDLT